MSAAVVRRRIRIAAAVFGVLWLLTFFVAYRLRREAVIERARERAARYVEGVGHALDASVALHAESVRFVAALPETVAAIDDPAARTRLEGQFLSFLDAHADATQVRLLHASGRELVRVNREGGRPIPARELQDKSSRYYVAEALRRPRGAVYVSRLDLNVEHEQVQQPPAPVVRLAAPVFGEGPEPVGVVVVNRDARPLLADFDRWRREAFGELVLVDADGNYLAHAEAAKLWGGAGLLATGASFARDEPSAAAWVTRAQETSATREDGVILAVAPVRGLAGATRAVLMARESSVLVAAPGEIRELVALMAAAAGLIAGTLVLLHRRARILTERSLAIAAARAATLTEAAAVLAHEVRNPLSAIVNSAGLLRMDPAANDPDTARLLEIVQSESLRLERTLDEFVGLARAGREPRQTIDIADLARDLVALARRDPRFEGDIQLELETKGRSHLVTGDPDQLRLAVWNIVRNAGDATRLAGGKRVCLRVAPSTIGAARAVELSVTDDGTGPPGLGDRGRAPAAGGLGLVITTGVVSRHAGSFELRARPDGENGSLAVMTLPAAGESA